MKPQTRDPGRFGSPQRRSKATQKSISVRLLTITAAVLAVLAVASYAWHAYQLKRLAPNLLEQARALEAEGRHREAAERLYQYLEIDPDNALVRLDLAETYDAMAKTIATKQRAIELYTEALQKTPPEAPEDKAALVRRIASLTLELALERLAGGMENTSAGRLQVLGGLKTAGQTAAELLQADPDDKDAWRILALSSAARQDLDDSVELPQPLPPDVDSVGAAFRQALSRDPGDPELALGYARILRDSPELLGPDRMDSPQIEREQEAEQVVDDMVTARPDDPQAYLVRHIYRQYYSAPGETAPREAAGDLAKALELGPDQTAVRLACGYAARKQAARLMRSGSLIEARRRYQLAREHYQGAIELAPADAKPYLMLAQLHREQDENGLAVTTLEEGRTRAGAEHPELCVRLAECLLARPFGDEAAESSLAERVSRCLEVYDHAVARCRPVVSEQTARAWDRVGRRLEAQLALRKNEPQKAVSLLDRMLIDPASLPMQERISLFQLQEQACRMLKRWEEAARAAEAMARLQPQAIHPRLLAAAGWREAGQPASTVRMLKDALARNGLTEIRVLLAAAQLEEQRALPADRQDWSEFLDNLDQLKTSNQALAIPHAWRLAVLEAAYLQVATSPDGSDNEAAALKCLRDAEIAYPESLGFLGEAAKVYRQMQAESDSTRAEAKSKLVAALGAGDTEAVRQSDDALRALAGEEESFWDYYHARRLIAEAQGADDPLLESAAELQAKVTARYSQQPAGYVLAARIAQKREDAAGMLEACREAFSRGERGEFVSERLVSLLMRTGQLDEAESRLADLEEFLPLSDTLRGLKIASYQRQGDHQAAIALAEQDVSGRPDNVDGWLRLGQLLAGDKRNEAAEDAFKQALKRKPDDRRALSALFALYEEDGDRTEEAREVLNQLAANQSLFPSRRAVMLAMGDELLGDRAAAEKKLREAIAAAPKDTRLNLELAAFQLRGGGADDLAAAEKTIREFLGRSPESPEAKRALASVLGLKGGQANPQEAIGLLEELAAKSTEPAEVDASLLGQLYEREADWQAADRAFAAMAAASQTRRARLASYVDRLLERGDTEEASTQLAQLEQIAPSDLRTTALKIRWLQDTGRAEEILSLVSSYRKRLLKRAGEDEDRKAAVSGIIGDLYTLAGQYEAAEAEYRELAKTSPQGYRPLAVSLARQGKMDEAIGLCLEASKSDQSAVPAGALCSVLVVGSPTDQQRQQAEPLLAKAAESADVTPKFLSALAAVRLSAQRPDDAVALYQRVLQDEPDNHAALNNLAVLLAEDPAKRDEALAAVDRALDLAGMRPDYLDTKATILLQEGRAEEAIALLEKAVSRSERDPDPVHLLHLASAYQSVGQIEEARQKFLASLAGDVKGEILTKGDLALLSEMEKKFPQ